MPNHPDHSAQQLWQCQPVEGITMSIEEIRRRSARFERKIMWRNLREYLASLFAVGLLGYFFATSQGLFRVTFALFILGLVSMVVQLYRRGSTRSMPGALDTSASAQFYRAELQRQLDLVRSVWWWYLAPLVPGFIVYTIASAVLLPRPSAWLRLALLDGIVAAMFFWIWRMNTRAAICLRRMIDELKEV